MNKKVYCKTCKYSIESIMYASEFYICTHKEFMRYTDTYYEVIKRGGDCSEINKNNDCKYYKKGFLK